MEIMLDVILIIIGVLCMIAGLAGCILPFLPGQIGRAHV